MIMKIRIDHIGIAVNSLDESSVFWKLLGLTNDQADQHNEEQGVNIRFLPTSSGKPPQLELLEPTGEETPIGKFLASHGPGIQQLAFEVEDISEMISHLLENGVRMIDDVPREGAHGTQIAFVHPKSTGGVLIELVQYV